MASAPCGLRAAPLALALLAATVAAWPGQVADTASLLQVALGTRDSPCTCLNWKEVYASGAVDCHKSPGYEYAKLMSAAPFLNLNVIDWIDDGGRPGMPGRCENFLQKFDDNFCINQMCETPNTTQWCYVSAECSDLKGGKAVNQNVSAKVCTTAESLQDRSLDNYNALVAKFDLKYPPKYNTTQPPWQFFAKLTKPFEEYMQLFYSNCDPIADAPWCPPPANST